MNIFLFLLYCIFSPDSPTLSSPLIFYLKPGVHQVVLTPHPYHLQASGNLCMDPYLAPLYQLYAFFFSLIPTPPHTRTYTLSTSMWHGHRKGLRPHLGQIRILIKIYPDAIPNQERERVQVQSPSKNIQNIQKHTSIHLPYLTPVPWPTLLIWQPHYC